MNGGPTTTEEDGYLRDLVTAVMRLLRDCGTTFDADCVRALVHALSHAINAAKTSEMRGGFAPGPQSAIVEVVWSTLLARRLSLNESMRPALVDAVRLCGANRWRA